MGITRSKLKRRLRKKNHLGEFQEFGFEVLIKFNSNLDEKEFTRFLDEFIEEIEKQKLLLGGSGNEDDWEGFITSAKKFASPTADQKEFIKKWLESRSYIETVELSDFKDAWND